MRLLRDIDDRNIWLIYLTILLVGAASGVAISLLALHLDDRGFDENQIGALAAWGASGIVGAALIMGRLVERFSAKGVLFGSLVLYACTIASLPQLTTSFANTALVRVFDGVASAGIWISSETALLSRAKPDKKAIVTSLYAASISVGYIIGSVLARQIAELSSIEVAFVFGGAISAVTAVMIRFRLDPDLKSEKSATSSTETDSRSSDRELSVRSLVWAIKNSCFGNFSYGYFQASVVLFLPLYLVADKGITREQTMLIPGFFALGMLMFVNVAGVLGDRYGHLRLMRLLGVVGTMTIIGFVVLDSYVLMCVAVWLAGATLASISPISLALQGAILPSHEYGRGSSVYNGFYALGMMLGPAITGALFKTYGGPVMLYHLAALWAAFVLFSVVFAKDDPAHAQRLAAA